MNSWCLQINPWADAWWPALGRACEQGGAALLLVWLVCRWFPRLPARGKCWLWRLAYLKLLVAGVWSSPVRLFWLPVEPSADPVAIAVPVTATPPLAREPVSGPEPAQPAPSSPERLSPAKPHSPQPATTTPAKATVGVCTLPSRTTWLGLIWGVGVSGCAGLRWRDWRRARRLGQGCGPLADEQLQRCTVALGREFQLRSLPQLRLCETIASPLFMGLARPVILLPAALVAESNAEQLRLMIAHELAHFKRRDLWWNWLAAIAEGLFFFHPALWLARREWRLAQEQACDELVLRRTRIPASSYGKMLVEVAARQNFAGGRKPILATVGMAETKEILKRRIHAMKYIHLQLSRRLAIALAGLLVVGAMNLVPWRLEAQVSEPPRTTPADRTVTADPTNPQTPATDPGLAGGARRGPHSGPTPASDDPIERLMKDRAGRRMGPGFGEMAGRRSMSVLPPPTQVVPARFEATVYEVQAADNRIDNFDAQALEGKAATTQGLAKALAQLGSTRILYKIDQAVNLCGESILLGSSEPMVTGSRTSSTGAAINTVTYQQIGLRVNLSANAPPPSSPRKPLDVQVNFDLSVLADSGVEISPGVKAPSIRNVQLSHSETPKFGKPSVLLSVSAPSGGEKGKPVAYVVRSAFSELER